LYGYVVYRFDITGEVTVKLIPQAMRIASRFEIETILSIVEPQQAQHAVFEISPVEGA
jgi:hypothetical protein